MVCALPRDSLDFFSAWPTEDDLKAEVQEETCREEDEAGCVASNARRRGKQPPRKGGRKKTRVDDETDENIGEDNGDDGT